MSAATLQQVGPDSNDKLMYESGRDGIRIADEEDDDDFKQDD